ncbi:relaxase/mobilization nuclease domain-containing protein [Cyanobacteria bacterium FACHB-63]|nr:relaxase/mobilization nuclease domain-containing protein [Cyanobacteria bacterium FACHB-63]
MLANITKGQNFSGCLRYVLSKAGAERIGGNMEGATVAELQREFDLGVQRQERRSPQKVTQAVVCHTSLSVEVGRNLDDATWNAIATDYLTAMGFTNNQFIAVRHTDTQHDHIHLVVSRLRLDGTTVETWLDYHKAQQVLRQLEQDYQLRSIPPSWEVKIKPASVGEIRQFHRTGEPSVRAMLQVAIGEALSTATTIEQFQNQLAQLGVAVRLRQIQSGIAGISYKLNKVAFPGYKLGKRYTWSRVHSQLEMNYE